MTDAEGSGGESRESGWRWRVRCNGNPAVHGGAVHDRRRRMLFERRFPVYAEFGRLGQLETGAIVRVSGLDAGEVTAIEIPLSPEGKFRVRMEVREELHQLVRVDSIASTQTEGLVGAVFVNITGGTDKAQRVVDGGTINSREPFILSDLFDQASETVALINTTVDALSDDAETAVSRSPPLRNRRTVS